MPRLSEYTEEMADKICDLVAGGSNLTKIGQMDDMPCRDTIYKWKRVNEAFADNYTRARDTRADARADRIDGIIDKVESDELPPDRARVMIDAIKWMAGKEAPKRYGDKVEVEVGGNLGLDVKLWE